jgi:hypothetical protein
MAFNRTAAVLRGEPDLFRDRGRLAWLSGLVQAHLRRTHV